MAEENNEKKKKLLLEELKNTWCKLAPSPLEGIGVFAVRDIPVGSHPFGTTIENWIGMTKDELSDVSPEVLELVKTYCLLIGGKYYLPECGFKTWDMIVFLNHAKNPNVVSLEEGDDFVTTRPIKKGEELLIDYDTIDEDVADYRA